MKIPCVKSVSCVQKTLHWPRHTGKEDFVQGYCTRAETELNSTEEKVEDA